MAEVVQDLPSRLMLLPVSGAGADVPAGTLMMPGVSADVNIGVLIPVTATSNARAIGVLSGLHDFSVVGDCTYTGTSVDWFLPYSTPERVARVQLIDNCTLVKVDYDLAGTGIAVASATSTVITITSYEDEREDAFFYVRAGTGIGQVLHINASAAGTATLASASSTTLDSSSKLVSILPFFYETPVWLINTATVGNKLTSTAAVGTGRAVVLSRNMVRNGLDEQLNNLAHHNLTGLNSLAQLNFYAFVSVINSAWHRIA